MPNDICKLDHQQFFQLVQQARKTIQAQRLFQPAIAFVLGSGLGTLADNVQHAHSIDYAQIPGMVRPYAAGHSGRLVTGYFGGMPVVLLQGRSHRYEGHSTAQLQYPVHLTAALGAKMLVTTNAAGGLNSRFEVGDLMVIDSHIDLLWQRPGAHERSLRAIQPAPDCWGSLPRGRNPYSQSWIIRAREIARQKNVVLHQGCYLATLGPNYETRSEYRAFRQMGADAVGMSTIPEVLAARDLGMELLAFSVITNVASTDLPTLTTHDEVVQAGRLAGPRLKSILEQMLSEISGQPD